MLGGCAAPLGSSSPGSRCWRPSASCSAGRPRRCASRRDASDLEPGLLQVDPALRGAVSLGNGVYVQFAAGRPAGHPAVGHRVARGRPGGARSPPPSGTCSGATRRAADGGWARARRAAVAGARGRRAVAGQPAGHRPHAERPRGHLHRPGLPRPAARAGLAALHAHASPGARRTPGSCSRCSVPGRGRRGDARLPPHRFHVPRRRRPGRGRRCCATGRYPIVSRGTDVAGRRRAPRWRPRRCCCPARPTGSRVDGTAYTTLDLRHRGRVDTTVWQPDLTVPAVRRHARCRWSAQHSTDVGRMPTAAGLGHRRRRGRGARVHPAGAGHRDPAARRERRRSPPLLVAGRRPARGATRSWHALVDRLSAKDVRLLTSVSPSLALHPRALRPGRRAEPAGHRPPARLPGRRRRAGARCQVARAGPGRRLGARRARRPQPTRPRSSWYTQVLANRMRARAGLRLAGARRRRAAADRAAGRTATRRPSSNLARAAGRRVTRQACVRRRPAGLPAAAGHRGRRTPCRRRRLRPRPAGHRLVRRAGLGAVLPATLNAGLSGMTIVYSAVGGTSTRVQLGRSPARPHRRAARAGGPSCRRSAPLLVTADGDRPAGTPQVWDSPARLPAFARSSRVFAALAQYRRTALRQASGDGLPVVRPVWLAEPDLSQDSTAGRVPVRRLAARGPGADRRASATVQA